MGEPFASGIEKWISADHERAGLYCGQGREDCIKIVFGARVEDVELQPKGASPFLHVARQAFSNGGSWVDEKGNFTRRRDHLVQQLQPFRPQLSAQCGRARNITARSVEARNKSHLHRVAGY